VRVRGEAAPLRRCHRLLGLGCGMGIEVGAVAQDGPATDRGPMALDMSRACHGAVLHGRWGVTTG